MLAAVALGKQCQLAAGAAGREARRRQYDASRAAARKDKPPQRFSTEALCGVMRLALARANRDACGTVLGQHEQCRCLLEPLAGLHCANSVSRLLEPLGEKLDVDTLTRREPQQPRTCSPTALCTGLCAATGDCLCVCCVVCVSVS
jgi:hypothetical protein